MITVPSVIGFAAWSWWERSVERERVDLTVIAPTVGEIKTIAQLANLETKDMEQIWQQVARLPRCPIDDFSAVVESRVAANTEKKNAEKARAKLNKTADDDDDEDEEEEKKVFHGWHLLALYRLSQVDAQQALPLVHSRSPWHTQFSFLGRAVHGARGAGSGPQARGCQGRGSHHIRNSWDQRFAGGTSGGPKDVEAVARASKS